MVKGNFWIYTMATGIILATAGAMSREYASEGFVSRATLLKEIDDLKNVHNKYKSDGVEFPTVEDRLYGYMMDRIQILRESTWYVLINMDSIEKLYHQRYAELISD